MRGPVQSHALRYTWEMPLIGWPGAPWTRSMLCSLTIVGRFTTMILSLLRHTSLLARLSLPIMFSFPVRHCSLVASKVDTT